MPPTRTEPTPTPATNAVLNPDAPGLSLRNKAEIGLIIVAAVLVLAFRSTTVRIVLAALAVAGLADGAVWGLSAL